MFGEEVRPVKLRTVVKGYAPTKTDFLFERRLNDHISSIVAEFSKSKPALVFCRYAHILSLASVLLQQAWTTTPLLLPARAYCGFPACFSISNSLMPYQALRVSNRVPFDAVPGRGRLTRQCICCQSSTSKAVAMSRTAVNRTSFSMLLPPWPTASSSNACSLALHSTMLAWTQKSARKLNSCSCREQSW